MLKLPALILLFLAIALGMLLAAGFVSRIRFAPAADLEAAGYGQFSSLFADQAD